MLGGTKLIAAAVVVVLAAAQDNVEVNEAPAAKYSEEANAVEDQEPLIAKNCDEQDIFAEGNSFNLDQADIEDCTHLNLWNVNIGDNGTIAIVEAIMELGADNTVYRMDLGFNHISDDGAIALAKMLEQPYCTVEWLNIHGNSEIGVAGFEALSNALKTNKLLLSLDVGNNEMDDEQAAVMAKGFEVNTGLKELWLNTNKIGPQGAAAVFLGLSKNTGIVKVLMGGNHIGDTQSKIPLEALLSNNRVLEELDIGNNEVGDETAKSIANGLAKNNVLEVLDLDSNQLSEAGCRMIVGALEKNMALKKLWFTGMKFKDEKTRKVLQAVAEETNPTIRKVNARRLSKSGGN